MARLMTWVLITLALLVADAAGAQQLVRQRQDRRASLPTTPAEPVPELYVAAGNLTTVAFNAPLDRDSLVVDRTRFKWMDVGDRVLTLQPFADLGPGERLIMQVGFKDRALPTKAILAILSKAEVMDGMVEVDRRANTPEALLAAFTQKEAELEELKARCEGGPVGLALSEWLDKYAKVTALIKTGMPTETRGLNVVETVGYTGGFSALVAIRLRNAPGQPPWAVGQARITDSEGSPVEVLSIRMKPAELAPGREGLVVVEMKAPLWTIDKPFSVELIDARGPRRLPLTLKKE
ncbi:DUF2381 family protein [Hyalangium gracile]|uniref:DUF2381 family protein n=1 Tax=Hyalangium gracile TaxID=394092 RepID=UPI001CCA052F|nr:DUF2381 family protein [Hyalangium gracile]